MAIPEHIKRQAMDAVSHRETTSQIRLVKDGPPADFTHAQEPPAPEHGVSEPYRPISDDVKQQAMDAVSHPETRAQIRLVEMTGSPVPDHTPSKQTQINAEKIAQLHQSGKDSASVHQAITKDNFGRE